MRRHPCWLVGAGELSWIRPRNAAASRCGTRKVVVSCRMQLKRKTDAETRKRGCHKASAWNSYGSLRSYPCSFECLFCRTDTVREGILSTETSATAAASSVTPPFRRAGRNNCNLYNIISKQTECKLKWRKSPDLFASKMERYSVRFAASDGNAGTRRAETPEMRVRLSQGGMGQNVREQPGILPFGNPRRSVFAVQSGTSHFAGFKNASFP